MEHERMRFETMNIRQLHTRLNRITVREKLVKFHRVALEFAETLEVRGLAHRAKEYRDLADEAYSKIYGTSAPRKREREVTLDNDDYLKRIGAK